MLACSLIVVFLILSSVHAAFQVQIKTVQGNAYNISCLFADNSNYYGTSVNTKTVPEDWAYVSGNEYNLSYQRIDETHAQAGRCETAFSDAITGDGIFTAHFYIHGDVPSSAGVFTVAILSDPFSQEYELDLFVANLANNELKSGQPGEAPTIPLSTFVQKWVTARMTKSNGNCDTKFYSDSGALLYDTKTMTKCDINGGHHQIVVNARSRDLVSYDSSYVTIDSITWQQT